MMASLLSGAWGSFQRPLASHLLNSVANFSKYISKARAKRQPLTTKRAGKGYYKGNGCRKEGSLNSKAKFIKDMSMCTELMMPDMTNCTLKPYIASSVVRGVRDKVVTTIM